jgi:hypothetical protein
MNISHFHSWPSGQLAFGGDKFLSEHFSIDRNRENPVTESGSFALIALCPKIFRSLVESMPDNLKGPLLMVEEIEADLQQLQEGDSK